MGGLAELDVKAGDTLLCIPSLGQCGSASVRVGLALGANVVVVARNEERLKELAVDLQAGNALKTVVLIGDGALCDLARSMLNFAQSRRTRPTSELRPKGWVRHTASTLRPSASRTIRTSKPPFKPWPSRVRSS
jgi:NAD(P)-dependent dehydrogenase (short-subunit alcohol dehydrogenase family)